MDKNKLQADLFKGTAQYYAAYRPDLPIPVVNYLKNRFNLNGNGSFLDMGCGTGQSTFALASLFEKTFAFDIDEEMLKEARKNEPEGLNIQWQHRSDKDVNITEGPYRLVIACRAFNWMDQYLLLQKLHHIIEPGGGIALIGDGSFWTGDEPWQKKIKEVIQSFLGQERRAGNSIYSAPNEPYIVSLKKNGYKDPLLEAIPITREWNIQSIIGYLYSTSFSAKHLFGNRLKEFEETIKEQLMLVNGGKEIFIEHTEFIVQSAFQ